VTVPAPRIQPQAALSALAVHDQLVCCTPWECRIVLIPMADACTCENAADGGIVPNELETDFTTKA
jgi:hypothetical protein